MSTNATVAGQATEGMIDTSTKQNETVLTSASFIMPASDKLEPDELIEPAADEEGKDEN